MKRTTFFILSFLICYASIAQNSPARFPMVQFLLTPDHDNWHYRTGEIAEIKVMVTRFGIPLDLEIFYEYGPEMIEPDKTGKIKTKNGVAMINIGTMKEPGFKQLKVQTTVEGKTYRDQIKVGFDPLKIEPTVKMPDDFDEFWGAALAENAKLPMDAIVTYRPEFSTSTVDVYLVNMQNYSRNKRLYGWLCKPKKSGKYPVLFHPPGAGVKHIDPWTFFADQGFISLAIEIHGINPEHSKTEYKEISRAVGDYAEQNLDDKDNYYYKSAYVGCVRAIDYLTSLPEWDGVNVLVTGGSQGGALSIVTAGLDKRVTALAAYYPALTDQEGYLHNRAGSWPHMFRKVVNNTPQKIETMKYYDVVNFAKKITAPGFYSFGYNDNTCPPTTSYSAYNVIDAPKTLEITPITGHWRFGETDEKSTAFLKEMCGLE